MKRMYVLPLPAQKGAQRRTATGFTMIELTCCCVIIGILFATSYANLAGAQMKAKTAQLLENMHMVQVAAQAYATDYSGLYPATPDDNGPYMPSGSNTKGGADGTWPTNPFTSVVGEHLFEETITTTPQVDAVRNAPPGASPGTEGQVGYSVCDMPEQTSYCVTGTAVGGARVGQNGGVGTQVLSNH